MAVRAVFTIFRSQPRDGLNNSRSTPGCLFNATPRLHSSKKFPVCFDVLRGDTPRKNRRKGVLLLETLSEIPGLFLTLNCWQET